MRNAPLKVAVAGCGFFAQNHLHAWKDIPEVQLVAVCDRVAEKAEAAAAQFGARAYTDLEAMLANEHPDWVDVVTNVMDHRSAVEIIAAHKTHVICQKPMAETLEDAQAMVAACKRAGVIFMVHENFRWQTPLRVVKRVIERGDIGTPFFGRASFRSNYNPFGNQPYLAKQARFLIMDVGVHMIDVGRFYFGEPHSLMCHAVRVNPAIAGEDTFTIMLATEKATCVVDASFNTHTEHETFPQTLLTIEGDRGVINLREDFRLEIVRNGEMTVRTVRPPSRPWMHEPWTVVQDSVYNVNKHFVDCVLAGRQPETNGDDNLKVVALTFGAYEALERGTVFKPA